MAGKILLVDDDVYITEVLQTRFKAAGYETFTANDGEAALVKMKKDRPDLVVMDISMPKMDGYAVVCEMKADEDLKHVPIIILTGKDSMQDIFAMEGVAAYLMKPFDFQRLLEKVKMIIGSKT